MANKIQSPAQTINLKIAGLYTNPNQLGSAPEGALLAADNIRLNSDNLAEPRRGLAQLVGDYTNPGDRANKLFNYQDKLLSHHGTDVLSYYSGSMWNDYTGSFPAPGAPLNKVHGISASSNFYFTTLNGIYKLDSVLGTPKLAGAPQGLDISGVLTSPSGSTWFADGNQVAYRVIWGIQDANGNVVLGPPSQRFIIANTSGSDKAVDVTFTVPAEITTDYFYQVYRSAQSGGATIEPSDDLQLVFSAQYVSGDTVTVSDITDDTLRGQALYTNANQDGIVQANYRPPFAKDLAVFRDSMFYGNTKLAQQFDFTILAVGPTAGVQINDVLTIAGVTYTGKSTENIASRQFAVVTSGTPAQNITDTANSLVRVINRNTTNTTVYAYYLSAVNDLPGRILIQARTVGVAQFSVQASLNGSTAYNPDISSAVNSTQTVNKNAVYISKVNEPEAVPLVNVLFVGSADKEILRVLALRDSLFILKEDGVFRISGTDPSNFNVQLFDPNARLLAPESAVTLDNFIFCLSTQGVIKVSDTGVSVISRPIEDQLQAIFGFDLQAVREKTFGVAYETDRTYHMYIISATNNATPQRGFVFNTFTNAWTIDPLTKTAGIVCTAAEGDGAQVYYDRLFFGEALNDKTNIERKDFAQSDYVDEAYDVNITAVNNLDITLDSLANVTVGDLLYQSSTLNAVIVAIDTLTNIVTVNITVDFTVDPAEILKAIPIAIEWVPTTAGNPGSLKQFRETLIFFKEITFVIANLYFYTDLSNQGVAVPIEGIFSVGWGIFGWGEQPWGGVLPRPNPIRTYVPKETSRCSQLITRYEQRSAYSRVKIEGISHTYTTLSSRLRR